MQSLCRTLASSNTSKEVFCCWRCTIIPIGNTCILYWVQRQVPQRQNLPIVKCYSRFHPRETWCSIRYSTEIHTSLPYVQIGVGKHELRDMAFLLHSGMRVSKFSWTPPGNILYDYYKLGQGLQAIRGFSAPKKPVHPMWQASTAAVAWIFPKDQIVSFGIQNLAALNIESVHDFIVTWSRELQQRETVKPRQHRQILVVALQITGKNFPALTIQPRLPLSSWMLTDWSLCLWVPLGGGCVSVISTTTQRKRAFMSMATNVTMWLPIVKHPANVTSRMTCSTANAGWCNYQLSKRRQPWILIWRSVYGYHDIISNKDMIEFHVDYWSQHRQEAAANDKANNIDQQVTPTTSIRISSRTQQ